MALLHDNNKQLIQLIVITIIIYICLYVELNLIGIINISYLVSIYVPGIFVCTDILINLLKKIISINHCKTVLLSLF